MREKRAACALALGLLTLGLFGCAAKAGTAPELLEPVGVRMDTEAVVRGEIAEWRAYDAFVVPETTELFLTQSGEIQEICVQLGEEVEAGQVLLRLDVEAERERIAQIDQELAYLEADNALTLEQMRWTSTCASTRWRTTTATTRPAASARRSRRTSCARWRRP